MTRSSSRDPDERPSPLRQACRCEMTRSDHVLETDACFAHLPSDYQLPHSAIVLILEILLNADAEDRGQRRRMAG
jgi:hypothetical protein